MPNAYNTLLVDDAGPVRKVLVNRPAVRNALNAEVIVELERCFIAWSQDPELRCVVLSGAGDKAFVAGADIAAMAEMSSWEARGFAEAGHKAAAALEGCSVPVIAAINGYALGGGLELALCADFIYAANNATLGFPEVGLGVIPGFGGTQRLATRVGVGRAREMIFSGQMLSAEMALACGLVNAVFPPEQLLGAAMKTADTIASKGPLAVAEAKRAMRLGQGLPLERALAFEQELFAGLFATADQKEGMSAFLQKRSPLYRRG